jgi:hypothetical protein
VRRPRVAGAPGVAGARGRTALAGAMVAGLLGAGPLAAAEALADGAVDEAEIARALQADQGARAKPGTPPATPATSPAAAVPPPLSGSAPAAGDPGELAPQVRSFQTLNPDVSAIVDFAAGWFSDDGGTIKSGDDPQSTGFKVQEVELALQQVVDPYFRADIFLTIPNLSGLEVEEAFLTTTALPGNLQVKAGIFRAGLGRQNAQHLHLQDFSRRPVLNAELLGVDGLRAPGFETNWLVPGLPFYLVLSASAFSVDAAEPDQPLQTFGGGARWNFSYVGTARAFFPLSEATSLYVGLDYARGKTSQSVSDPTAAAAADAAGHTLYDGLDDNLFGGDLYLKWKPANQAETYASLAWQTEYFVRQLPNSVVVGGAARRETEGGLYSQVVVQTARRFFVGLRGELLGAPAADNLRREVAGALSLTWALSEFARLRLYGETRRGHRFLPLDPAAAEASASRTSGAVFLQLEAAIGAHGAHPF